MTVKDHPYVPATRGGRRADLWDRALAEGARSAGDLAEADSLIADLAALVDAGLVAVRPSVLGPARYEAAADLGDAA